MKPQDLTEFGIENRTYSIEEWQAIEERTGEKFEYYDGRLVHWQMMAGGTIEHSTISANASYVLGVGVRLREQAKPKASLCNVHTSDLQLKLAEGRQYVYPDAAVVCGDPVYDANVPTAIRNPVIVVEVVSPSSARFDSGKKFHHYASLDSLREYVLIEQDDLSVEVRSRKEPGGPWQITFYEGRETVVPLPALDIELPMVELYRGVSFEWENEV